MPIFEVTWSMYGRATVEADTAEEAEDVLHDSMQSWSSIDLESMDVDGTDVDDVAEM